MTTSNHRPYTYPEGKIKVDGNPHTRDAAVCYTDYAIGNFIKKPRKNSGSTTQYLLLLPTIVHRVQEKHRCQPTNITFLALYIVRNI